MEIENNTYVIGELRVGDYVFFLDYSSATGDLNIDEYRTLMTTNLKIKSINGYLIEFFELNRKYNYLNSYGSPRFQKNIKYTREMKIKELLKNESI